MESSPEPGQELSVSAFKGCNSVLKAFSFWSARTSRSPELLRCPRNFLWSGGPIQFCHPSWVVSLVLQNLIGAPWSSSGHMKGVFLILKVLFILASASAGRIGCSMLCLFVALFPGAGVGCPLLSSRTSWRRLRVSPPLLLCLRASLYRPNQRETIAMGNCYILCGRSGVTWSAWAAHRQRCERFLFAAGCSMKELSKTTVSFCLRMPLSRVCRLSVTERSVLCPLSSVRSCCRSVSSWEELCCDPGGRARMWLSCSSLRGCYFGAVAPRFLAAFHQFCVVAVQALVLPGPALLDISLVTTWRLVLGPCFLVRSPTIRRLPMGCHGWWFVYVSTFWNAVCIISWKYWITFLQNLSFLLK